MSTNATASAGSRRFWIAVLCFAVVNAAVWVGYDRWERSRFHHLLQVTQFTPGDGATVHERPTLAWSFNLDIAPASPNAEPPGTITPNIPGAWRWNDPRTLTFTPAADFPRATAVSVALSAEAIHTPEGFRLNKPFSAKLLTPALAVLEGRQVSFDEGDRAVIEISFNDRVLPAELTTHLTLRGSDGRDIHFQPHGDVAGKKVRIVTDALTPLLMGNASPSIAIHVGKGLIGQAGPLGLETDFTARVPIAAEVLATGAEGYFPSNNQPFVQVRFNNPVDVELIRQVISVEPAVPVSIASGYQGIDLHGPFLPGTRYAIKFAAGPAGVAGKRSAAAHRP